MSIVVGNGHGGPTSNPERGYFAFHLMLGKGVDSVIFPSADWATHLSMATSLGDRKLFKP